jgi:hypothetical protein
MATTPHTDTKDSENMADSAEGGNNQ